MARLAIDLRVDGDRIYYNVIHQDKSIRPNVYLRAIRYHVSDWRFYLSDAGHPELYYPTDKCVNIWLGGSYGSTGRRPFTTTRYSHANVLDQQRKILAVLLRFAKDYSIQFEQRRTP